MSNHVLFSPMLFYNADKGSVFERDVFKSLILTCPSSDNILDVLNCPYLFTKY